jgi:non-ribosomal peptide synthetase component F
MATLVELWERQAAATPHAVAVISGAEHVTYGQLDRRAGVLARRLRARGVGPESLVGIWLERSVDQMVALLGVLKAGGAYVPLDPTCPAERLRYMVADSGVRLVVCGLSQAGTCPLDGVELLAVGRLHQVTDHPVVPPRPGNLAYVIYTSGSTGRLKRVAITHASISSFLESMANEPGLTAGDRVDISALEIFLPLTVGAAVVLAPVSANTDPAATAFDAVLSRA